MEIYKCVFMKDGYCSRNLTTANKIPSAAFIVTVGPSESLGCSQSASSQSENIVCDKKVIVSEIISPTDTGDESG